MTSLIFEPSKILNDKDFEVLIRIRPDLIEKMLRNKYVLYGPRSRNTRYHKDLMEKIQQYSTGLVYVMKSGTQSRFDMELYFENAEDVPVVKLSL